MVGIQGQSLRYVPCTKIFNLFFSYDESTILLPSFSTMRIEIEINPIVPSEVSFLPLTYLAKHFLASS